MAHASAGRCGLSGNEAHDRLFITICFYPVGGFGFHASSDLTDHHNGIGVRVVHEKLHGIARRGADDGVSTDSDGS